jgi:hypothetical protein
MSGSSWLNLDRFEEFIRAALTRLKISIESLRNHVVINPNLQNGEYEFVFPRMTRHELEALLIWVNICFPQEFWAYKLRESVMKKIGNRTEESLTLLRLLSTNEDNSLARTLLLFQFRRHGEMRSFFGNFDTHLSRALRKVRVRKLQEGKPHKPNRKRGYNDHGSRDPDSAWKRARAFWEDSHKQEEIERTRDLIQYSLNFITGFLE